MRLIYYVKASIVTERQELHSRKSFGVFSEVIKDTEIEPKLTKTCQNFWLT